MKLDLNLRVRVWALQAHLADAKVGAPETREDGKWQTAEPLNSSCTSSENVMPPCTEPLLQARRIYCRLAIPGQWMSSEKNVCYTKTWMFHGKTQRRRVPGVVETSPGVPFVVVDTIPD